MARGLRDRAFQAWWRISRPMTLGVRGIVRDEAGAVLLVKHTYTPGWHFPGGGVEKGETALQSLERELIEEAGARLTGPPVLLGAYANSKAFPNDHVLLYEVKAWTAGPPTSKGEILERGFFALNAPPPDVSPGTLRRIKELLGEASVSAHW
jgi:8-oxo-dGTP pyrophosphatase MutT (NUDIX family)